MRSRLTRALALMVFMSCASAPVSSQDANMKGMILDNLRRDHLTGVTLTLNQGHVVLEGTVRAETDRQRAQEDAERVAGVVSVDNRIAVNGQ